MGLARIGAVTWAGAGSVPGALFDDALAVIVISNPGAMPPRGGAHRLDLEFWDADGQDAMDRALMAGLGRFPGACTRVRRALRGDDGWRWRPPLAADAVRIRGFVAALPEGVRAVHVACEYGRSRSRAVAEWVARECACTATGDATGRPNVVLASLLDGLRLP